MINDADSQKMRNEELMADSATYQYEDEAIDMDMGNGVANGQPYTAGSGSFSDINSEEISGVAHKFVGQADKIAEKYGGSVAWVGLASAILLLQSIVVCSSSTCPTGTCTGRGGFALAAGLIPLLLCAAYVILTRYHRAPSRSRVALAAFSFCWWTLSVGVLTFEDLGSKTADCYPYNMPSNAYLALWGGFGASVILVSTEVTIFNNVMSRVRTMSNNHLLVMVAGLVVMFAAISPCAKDCSGFRGFAVAFGVLATVFVILQMKIAPMLSMKANSGMLAAQVVFWFAGTMFLTFFEPFKVVGNGFFACWAGLAGAMMMYMAAKKHDAHPGSNGLDTPAPPAPTVDETGGAEI